MLDPLVALLKEIRRSHKVSQRNLEACMELPEDTYRHIETGRRRLPDYRNNLVEWVQKFANCINANADERQRILDLMSTEVIEQFSRVLDNTKRPSSN